MSEQMEPLEAEETVADACEAPAEEAREVASDDNSKKLKDIIVNCAQEMAEIDGERKTLNRKAADIREVLVDHGVDKEAFKETYAYYKKKRHERDGYDESSKLCHEALSAPETGDLFASLNEAA